tara:strand:+ start:453 stop:1046 length:594 start_codon:yes stop_codon:yes gene_type:complete
MNANELIKFEQDIADLFNSAKIRAPVHLHGGNEESLINIFSSISKEDWVFTSWRSHYHCLLKGVSPAKLKKDIIEGKSITLIYPEFKIYSSAIVGGIVPIALGAALALKRSQSKEHVYVFMGEMTSETGATHEAYKYSVGFDLPITFIIENNQKSVCTDTFSCWGINSLSLEGKSKVLTYNYDLPWPHAGAGVRVQF